MGIQLKDAKDPATGEIRHDLGAAPPEAAEGRAMTPTATQFTAGQLPRPAGWQQRICSSEVLGCIGTAARRQRKVKAMTDPKDMSDPSVRPPFWQHRYYYLALKIVVLLARRADRAARLLAVW